MTRAYRKLLFPLGASMTVKPSAEGAVHFRESAADDSNAGQYNGWMVLLVKLSAAWRDIEVLIDNEHIDYSVWASAPVKP